MFIERNELSSNWRLSDFNLADENLSGWRIVKYPPKRVYEIIFGIQEKILGNRSRNWYPTALTEDDSGTLTFIFARTTPESPSRTIKHPFFLNPAIQSTHLEGEKYAWELDPKLLQSYFLGTNLIVDDVYARFASLRYRILEAGREFRPKNPIFQPGVAAVEIYVSTLKEKLEITDQVIQGLIEESTTPEGRGKRFSSEVYKEAIQEAYEDRENYRSQFVKNPDRIFSQESLVNIDIWR